MDSNNTCLLCSTDTTFVMQTHLRGVDNALKLFSTLTDDQQPGRGSNDKASVEASSSEVGHDQSTTHRYSDFEMADPSVSIQCICY